MSKHENKFIDKLQKGDKVFLVVHTRNNNDAWMGEVEFQGKSAKTSRYLWDEPKCRPSYITEYYYSVKFKVGKNTFTIKFKDNDWATENDLVMTNIDLEKAQGLLTDGYYLADGYMTTDLDKFKSFLGESNLLENAIVALAKKKTDIEKQLKQLFMFRSSTLAR